MKREEWEKVQEYDLSNILGDCTFLSENEMIKAIRDWWKEYGEIILKTMLKDEEK